MNDEPDLERLAYRLANESPRHAGMSTEQHVVAAFRVRPKRWRRPILYTALTAACLAISFVSIWERRAAVHNGTVNPPDTIVSGFVPLPYAQSDVPLEQAVIIQVDLPPSAWSTLNLPAPPAASGATIRADLLVGQDGVARAVRVVSIQ